MAASLESFFRRPEKGLASAERSSRLRIKTLEEEIKKLEKEKEDAIRDEIQKHRQNRRKIRDGGGIGRLR